MKQKIFSLFLLALIFWPISTWAGTTGYAPGGGSGDIASDTIWEALGDLACADANDSSIILGIGTNGWALLADDTKPCGIKWGAAPASAHADEIAWTGTSVLDHGAAFSFGSDDEVTITHTFDVNPGADPTIAYSDDSIVITNAAEFTIDGDQVLTGIPVNGSEVTGPNLTNSLKATFIHCTGVDTPILGCLADADIQVAVPDQDSHTHIFQDLDTSVWSCVNLYDGGNVPQDGAGGPDSYCDRDGYTWSEVQTCADSYDTPIAPWLGGPNPVSPPQNACADGGSSCPDRWCDAGAFARSGNTAWNFLEGDPVPGWSAYSTEGANFVPYSFKAYAQDGSSGVVEGFRLELAVTDLDVNDLADSLTSPNDATTVLRAVAAPTSVGFEYPAIYTARNETGPFGGRVGSAFIHYVTKSTGITDNAVDVSHGAIDVAMAIGDNDITTRCTDRFDDGGSPQVSCLGSYVDIIGCPDTFCDIDGTTSAPDLETFTAEDIELVMLGGNKDSADTQHTHSVAAAEVTVTQTGIDNEENPVMFGPGGVGTGNLALESDAALTFNPLTDTLSSTEFVGGGAGITACDGESQDSTPEFDATTGVMTCKAATKVTLTTVINGNLLVGQTTGGEFQNKPITGAFTIDQNGLTTPATRLIIDECNITFKSDAWVVGDIVMCGRATGALTLLSLDCTATGTTAPSAQIVDVVECTSGGATCVNSGGTITAAAKETNYQDAVFTDGAIDDTDWWGVKMTSATTEATLLHCQVEFSRD